VAVVLVTDGEQRSALAVVRSLGRAGHRVFVASSRRRSLAGASRYCRGEVQLPDPLQEPARFVDGVAEAIRRWGIEILLPISEASLLALLPERERLGVTLPFAGSEEFNRICDKASVMEVARGLGIGIPAQVRLEEPEDAAAIRPGSLSFPLVLKPARSVMKVGEVRAKSSVLHLADERALKAALGGLPADAYPVLLQERIVGPGVGIFLLLWEGEVIASFAHRRLREKPPSGGVSVYRESVPADPELLRLSVELLRAFRWEGVAMVEYKVDERTGRPYLMEINGRFWGSLQLAIDAGVDFPRLLVELASGGRPAAVREYRHGVRSRWWWGDVDHLLARIRRSDAELALPAGAPGKARTALAFLSASGPGSRNEILRVTDLAPAVRESLDWFRGL
jgi:predicted ATP-grasp superfamily ATP-dependent carboligase